MVYFLIALFIACNIFGALFGFCNKLRPEFDSLCNYLTIPVYPGILIGHILGIVIIKIEDIFAEKGIGEFLMKNPLDLVKFRIRIEKK